MPQYAGYAELESSLDANIIAQLSSDTGSNNPGANCLVDIILQRASSVVQAYARVGNIYTDTDLNTLSAANDGLLVMLTVDLATEMLFQRRAMKITPAVEARVAQARAMLEALRDGKMIFGAVPKAADAGVAEVAVVPINNLAWYNNMSSSAFFRPRATSIYRGG